MANLAIDAAFALARDPKLSDVMRRRPLPAGLTEILAFMANEAPFPAVDIGARAADEGVARDIFERYLLEVLLYPGAPAARILGLNEGADAGLARRHLKLLMQWIQFQQGTSDWRKGFAERIVRGWKEYQHADTKGAHQAEPPARQKRIDHARRARRGAWIPYPTSTSRRPSRHMIGAASVAIVVLGLIAAFAVHQAQQTPAHPDPKTNSAEPGDVGKLLLRSSAGGRAE